MTGQPTGRRVPVDVDDLRLLADVAEDAIGGSLSGAPGPLAEAVARVREVAPKPAPVAMDEEPF